MLCNVMLLYYVLFCYVIIFYAICSPKAARPVARLSNIHICSKIKVLIGSEVVLLTLFLFLHC